MMMIMVIKRIIMMIERIMIILTTLRVSQYMDTVMTDRTCQHLKTNPAEEKPEAKFLTRKVTLTIHHKTKTI